jgi:hypothetical protein
VLRDGRAIVLPTCRPEQMVRLFLALVLVQLPTPPETSERLLGLLTLPQVFGAGACVPFEPRSVALFSRPRARDPIAHLQVDHYWTFPANGGCEGLEVRIHQSGRPAEPLPTEEFDYEAPAAIVVARDGDWFKVRTTGRSLWLRGTSDSVYLPLRALLTSDRLIHLTSAWDGSMYTAPRGTRMRARNVPPESTVRVVSAERRSGELWLLVETADSCDPDEPKVPRVRGWVQAYGIGGQPALWFFSRGC